MARILRAPLFIGGLLVSSIPTLLIVATVTSGDWVQRGLMRLGWRTYPGWLPLMAGMFLYLLVGIGLPAYLGFLLLGWVGAVAVPLLVLLLMARVGRW